MKENRMRQVCFFFIFAIWAQPLYANPFMFEAKRLERATAQLESIADIKRDLDILKRNIGRWWAAAELASNPTEKAFVLVDIAGFRVSFYVNGEAVFHTKALVGRKQSPTPVFRAEIDKIVLNPWWVIPESIAVQEILPLLKKDTELVSEKSIVIFQRKGKSWKNIKLEDVDWKNVKPGNFPFQFKQRPGEENPLGDIKFVSRNRHSIFIHGTIEPELFHAEKRAVSHGCVRLEDPLALAKLILKYTGTRFPPVALEEIARGDNEMILTLSRKIPIYFGYWTAWVDQNHKPHMREDIYGWDTVGETIQPEKAG
jgi:L,D-transpeptidase YcbB